MALKKPSSGWLKSVSQTRYGQTNTQIRTLPRILIWPFSLARILRAFQFCSLDCYQTYWVAPAKFSFAFSLEFGQFWLKISNGSSSVKNFLSATKYFNFVLITRNVVSRRKLGECKSRLANARFSLDGLLSFNHHRAQFWVILSFSQLQR